MSGVEVAVLQPKNVGRVVRFAETNVVVLAGTDGKEYADGNRVVRILVAITELPSAQPVAFPDCTAIIMVSKQPEVHIIC